MNATFRLAKIQEDDINSTKKLAKLEGDKAVLLGSNFSRGRNMLLQLDDKPNKWQKFLPPSKNISSTQMDETRHK